MAADLPVGWPYLVWDGVLLSLPLAGTLLVETLVHDGGLPALPTTPGRDECRP